MANKVMRTAEAGCVLHLARSGGLMAAPDPRSSVDNLGILLVEADPQRARIFGEGLSGAANLIQMTDLEIDSLVAVLERKAPDIVIISCSRPDADLIKAIAAISRTHPIPIAVFVKTGDGDLARAAIRAGASAYIVDGLTASRVQVVIDIAMERFRLVDALHKELSNSKSELESRKLIERAKGLLMEQRGLTEQAAYDALRKMAMARGKPVREIAETIVAISNILP